MPSSSCFPLWWLQWHYCSVQVPKVVDAEASWIQRDRCFDSPVFTPGNTYLIRWQILLSPDPPDRSYADLSGATLSSNENNEEFWSCP